MYKKRRRICVKCGQRAINPSTTFHSFPKPGQSNIERAQKWAQFGFPNENWDDIEALQILSRKNRCLCSQHFLASDFSGHGRLKASAIPRETITVKTEPVSLPSSALRVLPLADSLDGAVKSEVCSDTESCDSVPRKQIWIEPLPTTSKIQSAGHFDNFSEPVEDPLQIHSIFPSDYFDVQSGPEADQNGFCRNVDISNSCDFNSDDCSESKNSEGHIHSKYEFVDCWPSETRSSVPTITSLENSNINIVSTTDGNFLIDCGLICTPLTASISKSIPSNSSEKEAGFLNSEPSAQDLWQELEDHLMNENHTNVSKYIESYLSKINFSLLSNFFKAIIITSRDEDRWNLLPFLLLNRDGSKNSAYQVEALIFHGNSIGYSKTFLTFLRLFLKVRETTLVYFCSLEHPINNEDNVDVLMNPPINVQRKIFLFQIFETGSTYIDSLNHPISLPFNSHLNLESKVHVVFPLLNRHHDVGPNGLCKLQKENSPSSYDAAIVGVVIEKKTLPLSKDNFSVLFLGNSSLDTQDLMKDSLESVCMRPNWDVVFTSCKEMTGTSNFSSSFLNYCCPNAVIVSSIDKSHSREKIVSRLLFNVKSIAASRLPHRFPLNIKEGCKFPNEAIMLEQHIFSLHAPVTIKYLEKNAFIRQS